ncbi:MAG: beta-L-arabinofuranosidase domain-containing protein [Anaerolineae bacterium]
MLQNSPVPSRAPLQAFPWLELPLGAIQPLGWLRDQLRIQADGLSGHLDEVWASVGSDSGWLGGDGESWERAPYYCDGLVPLAYLLNDPVLIAKAQRWLDWSLNSQDANGFFGPGANQDWWPRMVMLKALVQHQEATGDPRVIPFMTRYFAYQASAIDSQPLQSWAAARGAENIYVIYWLYNRTGDATLLSLARKLFQQTIDWTKLFTHWPFTRPIREYHDVLGFISGLDGMDPANKQRAIGAFNSSGNYHIHHVVNVAMALKNPALAWLLTGDAGQHYAPILGIDALQRYHGLANRMFSGDEHLSGQQPFQGTELCAIVETLFSLQVLLQTYTDNIALADWAEELAYNALPAAFSPDMWSHQYDQQPNQVLVSRAHRNWYDNTDDSNLFGLEPHFGCCTANFHQGWPKYIKNLWLAGSDGSLAAVAYAPCRVRQSIGCVPVEITEETHYPFDGRVNFTIICPQPVCFTLKLRIPGWCHRAVLSVEGEVQQPSAGTYAELRREWHTGDEVQLELPMEIQANSRPRNAIAIQRGPLIYVLAPQAEWHHLDGSKPYDNWEITPNCPWNYALAIDPQHPEASMRAETRAVARQPFDVADPPVVLHARARIVPGWKLEQNSAGPLPESPVTSVEPLEDIELLPYAAARLRITEFPWTLPEREPGV